MFKLIQGDCVKVLAGLAEGSVDAVVLDPFLGSGTTLLACRALNRSCIGIEQSKEYCDIVKARFGNSTLGEPLEVVVP